MMARVGAEVAGQAEPGRCAATSRGAFATAVPPVGSRMAMTIVAVAAAGAEAAAAVAAAAVEAGATVACRWAACRPTVCQHTACPRMARHPLTACRRPWGLPCRRAGSRPWTRRAAGLTLPTGSPAKPAGPLQQRAGQACRLDGSRRLTRRAASLITATGRPGRRAGRRPEVPLRGGALGDPRHAVELKGRLRPEELVSLVCCSPLSFSPLGAPRPPL